MSYAATRNGLAYSEEGDDLRDSTLTFFEGVAVTTFDNSSPLKSEIFLVLVDGSCISLRE